MKRRDILEILEGYSGYFFGRRRNGPLGFVNEVYVQVGSQPFDIDEIADAWLANSMSGDRVAVIKLAAKPFMEAPGDDRDDEGTSRR